VLIEDGKIRLARMKKELITLSELEAAAHRQGFASLEDVESAVLEPGGTLAFIGKKPAPEESRHKELFCHGSTGLRVSLPRFGRTGPRPKPEASQIPSSAR